MKPTRPERVPAARSGLRDALDAYRKTVEATAMINSAEKTDLLYAEPSVCWPEGDFRPGSHSAVGRSG